MTRMTPLLGRNEQFARTYTPVTLGLPTAQLLLVTCLDHLVDPAIVFGLQLGDAPVIRNAGGRVTPAVIDDIAYLAFLAEQLFGRQGPADTLFEVAVVHHTQCGTGFLADPDFRRRAAEATGVPEAALDASAVADPHITVKTDVERLLASPLLSPKVSVSGHVYDIATGRVTTTARTARAVAVNIGRLTLDSAGYPVAHRPGWRQPSLPSPFCRSSAFITGTTSTSASSAMKNGSPNATMSDESGMSNTMKAVRFPSKVPKYIASGFQRSAVPWISAPILPSLTARLPDSTGIVILAMTRMTAPPLDAAAPVRASPCAWPTGVSSG